MLNEDYKEILRVLLRHKVKFLVVGAYALAAYGYPRATGDFDLWVEATEGNSQKIYKALLEFGASLSGITAKTFAEKGVVFQIGVAPRRVDILTHIDGVKFEQAYRCRKIISLEGVRIPFLSKNNLIENKRATGRPKDKLDIDYLKKRAA